ncbi:MAG: NUDIX domain-containing protein [Ilumatobacteraceae bacterium]|nr:MAG: NUDIX domain-containing protein [Actinomycetota bacterium]
MGSQHFRAGVVVVVRHPDLRRVLAFERADERGQWQLPQGGLLLGEEPIEGAWRELGEETGLGPNEVEQRAEYPEWVAYEWPAEVRAADRRDGKRRGQVQRWFLFDARSAEVAPRPDGKEFVDVRWVEPAWLVDHVPEFRRAAYDRVLGTL